MTTDTTDFSVDQAAPVRRTLGERLREARGAHGLSITDVAARTRVPARMLNALEEDRHEALPNFIFAQGFARSFAREVGLDPDEAARQLRAENTRVPHITPVTPLEPLEPERVPSRGLAWVSVGAVLVLIAGAVAWSAGMFDRDPEVAAATVTPAAGPAAPTPVAITPAPVALPTPAPTVAPTATGLAAGPAGPVTITATEDVWLQIKERSTGERAMSGILARGQTYAVPTGDLVLWTGKAGALAVAVDGRAIPPLGGMVETVRDLPLTPGALLARAAAPAAAATPSPTASR